MVLGEQAPMHAARAAPWVCVINACAGRQEGEAVEDLAARLLTDRDVLGFVADEAHALDEVIGQAVERARTLGAVLVAVGGDGTLNAVARAALEHDLVFAAIPQGTFNYFGRSHRIPQAPEAAIMALARGAVTPVQVGRLNGRPFLVNASFGLYPKLLDEREQFKRQFGRSRFNAMLAGLITLLRPHRTNRVLVREGANARAFATSTLFACNNALQLEQLGIDERASLEHGKLVTLLVKPMSRWRMVWMALRGGFGALGDADEIEVMVRDKLVVEPRRTGRDRRVAVALDGEQLRVAPPLVFEVSAQPLRMLTPALAESAESAGEATAADGSMPRRAGAAA